MNDLVRNNKKVVNKRVFQTSQNQNSKKSAVISTQTEEELDRGCCPKTPVCKPQPNPCNCNDDCCNENHHCGCNIDCCDCCDCCDCNDCNDDDCTKNCFPNPCGDECGYPLKPAKFTTSQAVLYPIETNRVYDTMMFRVFTDGKLEGGTDLEFNYTLGDLCGPLPCSTTTNVTIEKVCINYDSVTINPGTTSLEQLDVEPIDNQCSNKCQSVFEYDVCGQLNKCCNKKCMGQNVAFKQKGLQVLVKGLEIELTGKFGCSEFTATATPKYTNQNNYVVFYFNTLSGDIVVPANGKSFVLREAFQTQLTVDCIGKGVITQSTVNNQPYYSLNIPNGIDLVCCLQNVVSVLMEEQIVVLGGPSVIEPRLVDTFGSVCDFSQFSNNCKVPVTPHNHCGC